MSSSAPTASGIRRSRRSVKTTARSLRGARTRAAVRERVLRPQPERDFQPVVVPRQIGNRMRVTADAIHLPILGQRAVVDLAQTVRILATGRRQTSETARNHRPGSTAIPGWSVPTGLPGCGGPRPGPAPDCRVFAQRPRSPMARTRGSTVAGSAAARASATRCPNDSKRAGFSTPPLLKWYRGRQSRPGPRTSSPGLRAIRWARGSTWF